MWATKVIQSGAICEKCRKWPWRLSQGARSVFQNYCSSYETCTSMCQHQLCTSTLASLKFGLCKPGCVQNQLKTQFSRHDFCLSTFVGRHKFGFSTKFSADLSLRNSGACVFHVFLFTHPQGRHLFHLSTFYGFITGRFNAVTGRHALQIWIFFNHEVLAWPLRKDDTHTQIERCKQFFELLLKSSKKLRKNRGEMGSEMKLKTP